MKLLRTILFAGAIALLACTARASDPKKEGFGELTIDQVADLIAKQDADIYDNNTRDVYQKGHVPTAKWVAPSAVKESDLPQDHARRLVFYCANTH